MPPAWGRHRPAGPAPCPATDRRPSLPPNHLRPGPMRSVPDLPAFLCLRCMSGADGSTGEGECRIWHLSGPILRLVSRSVNQSGSLCSVWHGGGEVRAHAQARAGQEAHAARLSAPSRVREAERRERVICRSTSSLGCYPGSRYRTHRPITPRRNCINAPQDPPPCPPRCWERFGPLYRVLAESHWVVSVLCELCFLTPEDIAFMVQHANQARGSAKKTRAK